MTGQSDGKIFVMNLEECIRIRTNEIGGIALLYKYFGILNDN